MFNAVLCLIKKSRRAFSKVSSARHLTWTITAIYRYYNHPVNDIFTAAGLYLRTHCSAGRVFTRKRASAHSPLTRHCSWHQLNTTERVLTRFDTVFFSTRLFCHKIRFVLLQLSQHRKEQTQYLTAIAQRKVFCNNNPKHLPALPIRPVHRTDVDVPVMHQWCTTLWRRCL